jgi:hypothetical protein
MSKMSLIMESWKKSISLNEAEELPPEEKSKVLSDAQAEVDAIVMRVGTAAAGDEGLKAEILQSIISGLQSELVV